MASRQNKYAREAVLRNGPKADLGLSSDKAKIIVAQTKQLKIINERLDAARESNNQGEIKRLTEMIDNINGLIERVSQAKGK
ncbi:MAG: hypothetical protein R8M37_01170 [Alphaproteobacteria bacterium]|nr:hypothetical protein [Alphaproteobacteria bacterium]